MPEITRSEEKEEFDFGGIGGLGALERSELDIVNNLHCTVYTIPSHIHIIHHPRP